MDGDRYPSDGENDDEDLEDAEGGERRASDASHFSYEHVEEICPIEAMCNQAGGLTLVAFF